MINTSGFEKGRNEKGGSTEVQGRKGWKKCYDRRGRAR